MFGNYEDELSQMIEIDLTNNFRCAIFVSAINAVMRYLGKVDKIIYCKDRDPDYCSRGLVDYYGKKSQLVRHSSGNRDYGKWAHKCTRGRKTRDLFWSNHCRPRPVSELTHFCLFSR